MNQEKLLEVIANAKKRGCSKEELLQLFHVEKKSEQTKLIKLLQALRNDYVITLNQKGCYVLASYDNIFSGTLRLNKKGFGFVEIGVEGMEDIYIGANDINHSMDQDKVAVLRTTTFDSISGKILKVLEHGTKSLVGTARKDKELWKLDCDSTRIQLPVIIEDAEQHRLADGHKIKLIITEYHEDRLVGTVDFILGHENEPGVDILSILTEYDIFPEFNQEVMDQVQKVPDKVMSYQKGSRIDLTDTWICTIDGDDAKDLDDAIGISRTTNGYKLGVHIADVSYYVTEHSAIDQEAYIRGTSVYVVDRVVPMLPHHLSNGICSLHPHVDRLTMSCEMEFDQEGTIIDYSIFPSIIRSKERMTYQNVNKLLDGDEALLRRYGDHVEDFKAMYELSLKIRKQRSERGAIDFDTTESKIVVDPSGKVLDIFKRERYEAEKIIEDFMISANECVAKHMHQLKLPFIYRIHDQPEAKKIRDFAKTALIMGFKYKGSATNVHVKDFQSILEQARGSESYPVLSMWMLRSMSKAKYDVNCVGHFGLASENYAHFTSPIRRYPDLIVHRMLRKYVFTKIEDPAVIQADVERMTDIALQSSNRERAAVDAERAVESMKKAEYFEDKINQKFHGIISSVTSFGLFVELENTVEGLIHIQNMKDDYYHFDSNKQCLVGEYTEQVYSLGQTVQIQVKAASKKNSTIDFELVKAKKKKSRRKRWDS